MLTLEYTRRWQVASVLLLLAVLLATITPAVWFWPDRVRMVEWFAGIDKWAHGVTFAGLAVWFAGQYRVSAYWRIAIGLTGFGLLIELCQRAVGYRTAEWFDVAADVAGIIIGLAIATAGIGGWSLRFESWMLNRQT